MTISKSKEGRSEHPEKNRNRYVSKLHKYPTMCKESHSSGAITFFSAGSETIVIFKGIFKESSDFGLKMKWLVESSFQGSFSTNRFF